MNVEQYLLMKKTPQNMFIFLIYMSFEDALKPQNLQLMPL